MTDKQIIKNYREVVSDNLKLIEKLNEVVCSQTELIMELSIAIAMPTVKKRRKLKEIK